MSTRDELNRAADLNRRVDNAGGMRPVRRGDHGSGGRNGSGVQGRDRHPPR